MIICDKTIFILGAGASEPFKYPTGKELKKFICHDLDALRIAKLLYTEEDERSDCEQAIIKFKKNFLESGQNSIDIFLKNNPELKDLGKQLIAESLFPKEHESFLKNDKEDNWYLRFWNMIDNSFENIDKHNIHFITFNYDRSLEQFLLTCLYHSYSGKKSMEDCAKKIDSLNIIHVYGCLAPLPWQDKIKSRPYKAQKATRADLENVLDNLFIIGEERTEQKQSEKLKKIKSIMAEAKFIYFLGFGYDEENLNILANPSINAELLWGTSKNLGKVAERKAKLIISAWVNPNNPGIVQGELLERVQLFGDDVATFLKEHIYLI